MKINRWKWLKTHDYKLEYNELCPYCDKETSGVAKINELVDKCTHCGNIIRICSNCPLWTDVDETYTNYERMFDCSECPYSKKEKVIKHRKIVYRKKSNV